ncbi:protein-tyrosine phosphatase-like protein [Dunaliella salina]|uniref:Protein-tyrosine phosphatase-like protein n=1 Tax=Dunaliella salina TaxID=3046 RepID=A0ABQ7GT59_DUNSA|nr:protein-tyrosine phosphatase-like protein [Dunaliella salina]|eukprot:KAF5837797.1 protein-tyrosine phosphatase-like protein [Dunaliella salina]
MGNKQSTKPNKMQSAAAPPTSTSNELPPLPLSAADEMDVDSEPNDASLAWETCTDDWPFKVQDGLFIGSAMAESNLPKLREKGISHILTVAEGYPPSHPSFFTYKRINVQDDCSTDLMVHLGGPQGALSFIDSAMESGGACMVHCMAGVSRSATVVIAWLMQKHKISFDEAFRKVHAVRPWICPNPGFRLQLERFAALGYDLSKWNSRFGCFFLFFWLRTLLCGCCNCVLWLRTL